jgi:chromate transporter
MSEPSLPAQTIHPEAVHVSLGELALVSAKIGFLGFGGPVGQIAMMHKDFVEDKKWIDEDHYLFALSYCHLLPGPEAQQLATYVGWLLRGVIGGVIAGTLFVLPGAAIMMGLSWLYVTQGQLPLVADGFYGLRCVVLALIVQALVKIAQKSLQVAWTRWVAGLCFLALAMFNLPFLGVIVLAALVGVFMQSRQKDGGAETQASAREKINLSKPLIASAIWVVIWQAPLGFLLLAPNSPPILAEVGQAMSTLSLVTFGGAYTAVGALGTQVVEARNWLSATQMMDGLALVQAIPGPFVLVNQYVGFLAGWQQGGLGLALAAGLLASWCTFAPSFVWIFAGAPFAEHLRANERIAFALKGVTAAVVGVIASLVLWFAANLLLGTAKPIFGDLTLNAIDFKALALAIIAVMVLSKTKIHVVFLLGFGALVGVIMA